MKNILVSYVFVITLFIFMISSILIEDKTVSYTERRELSKLPNISELSNKDNEYFSELNSYLEDHFTLRDSLRNNKSFILNKILLNKINHNVVDYNNNLYEIDDKVNDKSIKHLLNKINLINKLYDIDNEYFIMIPDKNYYIDNIPKMDYKYLEDTLKNNLDSKIKWIDIKDDLDINSYYKSDIHFKMDKLSSMVSTIKKNMNLEEYNINYIKEEYKPFYGTLYSKGSNKSISDSITLLYSDNIKSSKVYNYEKKKYTSIYNKEYFNNVDSYDIFLSGASPVLVIENSNSLNNRELVMFRDSFSSSLAPLLVDNYSRITLVDLRYISSMNIKNVEEIRINKDTDVMFIYSVPIINNSFSLK